MLHSGVMLFGRPVRDRTRRLREEMTVAERAAWALLRTRRVLGYKFRRQYPMRGFHLDFYCPELKLALEIDGPVHDSRETYDEGRTAVLKAAGIRVVQIPNNAVSRTTFEEVVAEHLSHSTV